MAKEYLALGDKLYQKNKDKIKLESHYTGIFTGSLGKRDNFYFQFDADKQEKGWVVGRLQYFRYHPNSRNGKGWESKIFDINIGAIGYVSYKQTKEGRYITLSTGKLETILVPDRFWFIFRIVPISRLIDYIKDHTKFGRRVSYFIDRYNETHNLWAAYRQYKCKHLNIESEAMINGDTGQEWYSCPDCGFSQHIIWY